MLGALLLYVAGAVLHPLAHVAADAAAQAQVSEAETSPVDAPHAPAGGEEHRNCPACELTRAAALPTLPPMVAASVPVAAPGVVPATVPLRPSPGRALAQPRAPPQV